MFNSQSRLHYEEVSYLNSLYTRLFSNFRPLIFNPPSSTFKGPTGRWIQKHSWHVIPKQNTRWWVSYNLQRRKKSFLLIIMNLLSLWKLKQKRTFWLSVSKVLPHIPKARRWNFYRKSRNMSSKIIINFSSINNSKNNKLLIDFFWRRS